jgi:hypothetical protein
MQIKRVIISVRHDFLLFSIWTWNLRDSLQVVRLIWKTWTTLAINNWVALLRNFFLNCERGVFNSSLPCSGTLLRKPEIFYFLVKFWRLLWIKIFKFFLQRTLQLNVTLICVVCQKVLLDVLIGSDRTSQNTQITLYFLIVKVLILIPRRLFALVTVLSFYFRIQHNFD